MNLMELEDVVKNIDLRLSNVEQILPTLATKDDLKAFATRAELKEECERTRQQFNAVAERIEGYVRVVAEGHDGLRQRLDETNRQFEQAVARLDRRVSRLEAR